METPVTAFLRGKSISFLIKTHSNPVFTCEDAARERGVKINQIVKCMVGRDTSNALHVMLLPGDRILKIKKVRHLAGGIKVDLIAPDQLAEEYGLIVGAISPIQFLDKNATFYMDDTLFEETDVDISSGDPGAGIELKCTDLYEVLGAKKCDIISSR